MLETLPWTAFPSDQTHFWVHYGLCLLGLLLAIITCAVQFAKPAPYGRHEKEQGYTGIMVNQRIAHTLSDGPPGIILFLLVFFLYGTQRGYTNITFLIFWLCHYIHRGFIHPWFMRYSSPKTPLLIPLGGFFPNVLYSYINADWLGASEYTSDYYRDPRFIIGIIFFLVGFTINKYADIKLRNLRVNNSGYAVPRGGLFELISCPNYFGEMVEWLGWAIGTWSAAGLVWFLFGCGTFVPRSRQNHQWYYHKFSDYPKTKKALVPFIY